MNTASTATGEAGAGTSADSKFCEAKNLVVSSAPVDPDPGLLRVHGCMIAFAQRLKRLRQERNMAQATLGGLIGVSDVCIGHWEFGRRIPSAENLDALADVFGSSMDELWRGA